MSLQVVDKTGFSDYDDKKPHFCRRVKVLEDRRGEGKSP